MMIVRRFLMLVKCLMLVVLVSLSGCSTFKSLSASEDVIRAGVMQKGTFCKSVTKVYGGVAYSVCSNFHSRYDRRAQYIPITTESELVDLLCSVVGDTVVLPYSIYQQIRYGSVVVRK